MWLEKEKKGVYQIIEKAKQSTDFYERKFSCINSYEDLTYEYFTDLSPINKDHLKHNYDQMTNRNIDRAKLLYSFTSGTTGIPLKYPHSAEDRLIKSTILMKLRWREMGGIPIPSKMALCAAREREKYKVHPKRGLQMPLKYFTYDNAEYYLNLLKEFKPQILQGPCRALMLLVKWSKENAFDLKTLTIKYIENRSESMSLTQQAIIAEAFGAPVRNYYGSIEFFGIAYQCKYGHMHIVDDNVYVEILNDHDEVLPDGEAGEIVITGFNTSAMPLIRYKLGDRGYLTSDKTLCDCGSLSKILVLSNTRSSELIDTLEGKISPEIFKKIWMIMGGMDNIYQFQIVQKSVLEFDLNLLVDGLLPDQLIEDVKYEIIDGLGYNPVLNVNVNKGFVVNPNSLKLSWFVNECKQ